MRYRELDLARGFTVLLMPAVHVTMLYGNEQVYSSSWGYLLNWLASMPGAQLFMLLMGMSFTFSADRKSPRSILLKTGRWLLLSYTLNFLKFIVPALAGWLPTAFYASLALSKGTAAGFRLLLVGDILQLAAISLALIYLVNRFVLLKKIAPAIVLALIFISPVLWHLHTNNPFLNEFISLVTGNDPLVFFPVFPWLLFPLMGLLLGQRLREGSLNYGWLSLAGLGLMLPEISLHGFHFTLIENLYRPTPVQALFHLGFCFLWLGSCKCMAGISSHSAGFRLLNFCSQHITLIYCIQWTAIFWCIAIVPYRGLSLFETVCMSVALSGIIFILTQFFVSRFNSLFNKQQYG